VTGGLSLHTIDFAELSRLSDELDAEKPYIELIDGRCYPSPATGRNEANPAGVEPCAPAGR